MGAPLFTFSMKEKARGSTLHFLEKGNVEGGPTLHFLNLNEGVDDEGSALHFLDERKGEGFRSPLSQ